MRGRDLLTAAVARALETEIEQGRARLALVNAFGNVPAALSAHEPERPDWTRQQ